MMVLMLAVSGAWAQGGVTRVWAVDDGEKVKQEDLNHWAKTSPNNRVWDGTTIRVFGARNETVAFQVILEAAGGGAHEVNLILDSLRSGNAVITNRVGGEPGSLVGRYIELFVEHYLQVTQRSDYTYGAYGPNESRALPDAEHTGWIPDGLVPFDARVKRPAHGQGGAPFDIAAGMNQGVWVDIYIPKSLPAGTYRGTIRVLEGTATRHSIPVELQVYGFVLPDETHMKSFFSWNAALLSNRYGIPLNSIAYWDMFRQFMHVAHRHRMNLVDGGRALGGADGFVANLGGYYTGSSYTRANGYEGPGEGVGNTVYSIGSYDQPDRGYVSGFWPNEASAWQRAADAWEQWFLDNAPGVLRFKYMDDEPDLTNPSVMDAIRQKSGWITSSAGVGKNLHRLLTKEYVSAALYGSIDIWAVAGVPGIRLSEMRNRQSQFGEKFCMYNGTRPIWGQMEVLDNFATDNRVNPWIAWKYGVDLIFLWETSFFAEYNPPHPVGVNAWVNNIMVGSWKSWGGGMWLYAGREKAYPEDDRGVDGPVTSIRMKNFRRGQQDYEYLWLAKQAGVDVSGIVNGVVPRALDDWGTTSYTSPPGYNQQPTYPTRGYAYDDARRQVAEQLVLAGKIGEVPSGVLDVTPGVLPSTGGTVTVSWSSSGATSASLDNGVGSVPTAGTRQLSVDASKALTLTLDGPAGSMKICTDVSVGTPMGVSVLSNGCFSRGNEEWVFYTNGAATADSVGGSPFSGHVNRITFQQEGSNTQLFQSGIVLEPSSAYRLTFAARSSTAHDLQVNLCQHGAPFDNYGLSYWTADLSTEWTFYSVDFMTKNFASSVSDGRLMFWLAPYAKAGDVYMVDQVSLYRIPRVTTDVAPSLEVPQAIALLNNYPNPFNPSTTIGYELPRAMHVRLVVYDVLGREITRLVDEVRPAGTHNVRFSAAALPSGVYFYRLQAGGMTRTRSMVLAK